MAESLKEQKAALRTRVRAALRQLTLEQRESESEAIRARLQSQPLWERSQSVLLFAALADEPDVLPLATAALAAGKVVALPRFVAAHGHYEAAWVEDTTRDLCPGQFGIPEPAATCGAADLKRLDLILVPGLAFDWHGRRLGRGKGYYDRLLAAVPGTTCGVAFDQQLVSALPVESHDVGLNCILTPSRWLEF